MHYSIVKQVFIISLCSTFLSCVSVPINEENSLRITSVKYISVKNGISYSSYYYDKDHIEKNIRTSTQSSNKDYMLFDYINGEISNVQFYMNGRSIFRARNITFTDDNIEYTVEVNGPDLKTESHNIRIPKSMERKVLFGVFEYADDKTIIYSRNWEFDSEIVVKEKVILFPDLIHEKDRKNAKKVHYYMDDKEIAFSIRRNDLETDVFLLQYSKYKPYLKILKKYEQGNGNLRFEILE